MFINFDSLRKNGFDVHVDPNGIYIQPSRPKTLESIQMLEEEARLSVMQVEEIAIQVHEFQVWNAIKRGEREHYRDSGHGHDQNDTAEAY